MKVLHILHESLPLISGFTIRSKFIFRHQKDFAKVFVFTTFNFKRNKNLEIIDNIPYFRMNKGISFFLRKYNKFIIRLNNIVYRVFNINLENKLSALLYFPISMFTQYYIEKLVNFYKIDIIHQHTQYQIGKYSFKVAKKLNIPYVYEVRGFIEESMLAISKNRKLTNKKFLKFIYYRIKDRETEVLKLSDSIVTLSEPMKEELNKRGINEEIIHVIPNCIDPIIFKSISVENNLKEKLNLSSDLIIGYFGQLRWLEGIEILIKAIPKILEKKIDIKVLLIGNILQNYFNYLDQLIKQLNLSKNIVFLDALPHEELLKYYSIVDMIVLPRLNTRVTRIVTPLKPLEAMGFKTLVIASNLPALKYTIIDENTGILFEPENSSDLASKIIYYYNHFDKKREIEDFAYEYVKNNFLWKNIIPKYKIIYQNLLNK